MSGGVRIDLLHAMTLARGISAELAPHCVRSKAVGSVRRQRPLVSDIEFIVEPRMLESDLFGTPAADVEPIRKCAESMGEVIRGGERYIQIRHAMGSRLNLDLFIVHPPADWNVIMAIRTGPAKLSELAVTRMHKFGRRCQGGRIMDVRTEQVFPTPEEADFFAAAGLPFFKPAERDLLRAFTPIEITREVSR